MNDQYIHPTEASHGGIEVKYSELVRLGIDHAISDFSYMHDDTVYLEQDSDWSKWDKAKKQRGEAYKIIERYQENSYVQNYKSYTPLRRSA